RAQPPGPPQRLGKARSGRPGSQETSLRPKAHKPSWKGVGSMLESRLLAKKLSFALACASVVFAALGASVAFAGPTVTVRIEGESATLLPAASVTLNAPEPVSNCPANSVATAIDLAVGGNWDHGEANKGAGNFTETILGETHDFTHNSDTWAEWVDYKWGGGICTDTLNQGDEVLMVADHEPEPFFSPTAWP